MAESSTIRLKIICLSWGRFVKTRVGIILGVVLGILIVAGILIWAAFSALSVGNKSIPPITTNRPSPTVTIYSPNATSPQSSITIPPGASPISTQPATASGTQVASITPSTSINTSSPVQPAVEFSINITNFQVSGLTSGTVDAQITNTGSSDAHNVWAKVEIICQGSDGQDYLRINLGTIKARQTVSPQATINVSLLDGVKVAQSGATFNLTVYSDEKTQTMSYDYHP